MRLTVLTDGIDVTSCRTGNADIDVYLHRFARAEQERGLATVYVAIDDAGTVAGFFTLSPLSLSLDKLAHVFPVLAQSPYPQLGGYLLGRMGVHRPRQHNQLGGALVARAADIARAHRRTAGGVFLAVDPKAPLAGERDLIGYYERFGFVLMDPLKIRRRMVLAL